jgi:DNA-binding NarL/FixJ family response regulator
MAEADGATRGGPDEGSSEEAPLQPEVSPDSYASLTPQERRLLNLVADGLSDREIADRLSLSERVVAKSVEDMVSKLGLQTRTQAILFAINRAFQAPDPSSRSTPEEPK